MNDFQNIILPMHFIQSLMMDFEKIEEIRDIAMVIDCAAKGEEYNPKYNKAYARGIKTFVESTTKKYIEKCEKTRQNALKRWERNQEANEIDPPKSETDPLEKVNSLNDTTLLCNCMQTHANAYESMQTNTNERKRMQTNTNIIKYNINKNNINQSINKEVGNDFGLKAFFGFYKGWKDKQDGKSLAWHATDIQKMALVLDIAKEPTQERISNRKQKELQTDDAHKANMPLNWQEWNRWWSFAETVEKAKFNASDVNTICEVYEEHKDNPDVFAVLKNQVAYAAKQESVSNLKGLLNKGFNRIE